MRRLSEQSNLARYLATESVTDRIQASRASIAMLHAVDPGFDGTGDLKRYAEYQDEIARSRVRLKVRVQGDSDTRRFSEQLVDLLSRNDFSARLGNTTPGAVNVTLRGEVREYEAMGAKEVRLTVSIKTLDDAGHELASLERRAVAGSLSSFKTALELASGVLARKCETLGVEVCMGWVAEDKSW
jgi:hypothetical protein